MTDAKDLQEAEKEVSSLKDERLKLLENVDILSKELNLRIILQQEDEYRNRRY